MAIEQGYVYLKHSGFVNIINTIWGAVRLFEEYNRQFNTILPIYYNCFLWNNILNYFQVDYPKFFVEELSYSSLSILNIRDAESVCFLENKDLCNYINTAPQTTLHFYKQYKVPPHLFFNKFKLSSHIATTVLQHQEKLNLNYVGIHVRGGDYGGKYSSYEEFVKTNSDFIEKIIDSHSKDKILLCTDDQTLIHKYVDDVTVHNFSLYKSLIHQNKIIPPNRSLHTSPEIMNNFGVSNEDMCVGTILDFYLLLFSSKLYTNQHEYSTFAEALTIYNKYVIQNSLCLNQLL
jgi:hypothetical protein